MLKIKDLDREILSKLDDKELLKACSINKYFWNQVCDDDFLRRKFMKYPGIERYKKENETWKQFFLRAVHFISLMKEKYNYNYTYGDPEKQYQIFKNARLVGISGEQLKSSKIKYVISLLVFHAAKNGELPLLIYAINQGIEVKQLESALISAIEHGHLDVVIYLVEKGVNINNYRRISPLIVAVKKGYLEIVKYLIAKGANVNYKYNEFPALIYAAKEGNVEIMKQLIDGGTEQEYIDIVLDDVAKNGDVELLKYLLEGQKIISDDLVEIMFQNYDVYEKMLDELSLQHKELDDLFISLGRKYGRFDMVKKILRKPL